MKTLAAALMILFSTNCFAYKGFEIEGLSEDELKCYGKSMVGYDSVVNNFKGLPLEDALKIARQAPADPYLEHIINMAYKWEGTAHAYAIKTFAVCAKRAEFIQ